MWASDEWRISGADVVEVVAWADQQARGRYVTVWVEHGERDDCLGMIRLVGWEPTRSDNPLRWVESAQISEHEHQVVTRLEPPRRRVANEGIAAATHPSRASSTTP